MPAVSRRLVLQLIGFRIMNKVSLQADTCTCCSGSHSCGDLFRSAAVWWISVKVGHKWTFVFLPTATLLLHPSCSIYSLFFGGGGESFQKTTGSDVCGLFSLLESSYLGPSVGGELRCVKWEAEKPFYWPINQMCVCGWGVLLLIHQRGKMMRMRH